MINISFLLRPATPATGAWTRVSYENKRGLAKSREILVSCTVRLLLLGSPPGDLGPSVPYVTYTPTLKGRRPGDITHFT